jgi:hypothetical protein
MKKITALAIITLALSACDPYADEPGGTPSVMYVADLGPAFNLDEEGPTFALDVDSRRETILVFKANVLLDGASIEATPQSCWQAGAAPWLTAPAVAGASWYTCYYPSSATGSEPGGAIWVYPAATQDPADPAYATPSPFDESMPGIAPGDDLIVSGTIQSKSGDSLQLSATLSAGRVTVTSSAASTTPGGATVDFTAALENRVVAGNAWVISGATVAAVIDPLLGPVVGSSVAVAGRGTLPAATTGIATITYTPPATLPTNVARINVTLRATNRSALHTVTISIPPAPP